MYVYIKLHIIYIKLLHFIHIHNYCVIYVCFIVVCLWTWMLPTALGGRCLSAAPFGLKLNRGAERSISLPETLQIVRSRTKIWTQASRSHRSMWESRWALQEPVAIFGSDRAPPGCVICLWLWLSRGLELPSPSQHLDRCRPPRARPTFPGPGPAGSLVCGPSYGAHFQTRTVAAPWGHAHGSPSPVKHDLVFYQAHYERNLSVENLHTSFLEK